MKGERESEKNSNSPSSVRGAPLVASRASIEISYGSNPVSFLLSTGNIRKGLNPGKSVSIITVITFIIFQISSSSSHACHAPLLSRGETFGDESMEGRQGQKERTEQKNKGRGGDEMRARVKSFFFPRHGKVFNAVSKHN